MPIALEIRLQDLVTVVILNLVIVLLEGRNPPGQKIRKRITCANARRITKGKYSLKRGAVLFILLSGHKISAEIKVVRASDFCDLIFVGERRISVVPREVARPRREPPTVRSSVGERYFWQEASETVVEQPCGCKIRRPRGVPNRG